METATPGLEVLLRLGLAVLVGGALGLERQWHHKPAGLRTHMMVSLGAATFALLSMEIFASVAHGDAGYARVDPTRLLQGLVGGLGFLGAGTIVHARGSVAGLTTAASIWLTGAIGAACGGGHYLTASIATGLALVVLDGVGYAEHRLRRRRERRGESLASTPDEDVPPQDRR